MASLSPVTRRFILHWGEMGTRWGVNRTVAQIHALLFLAAEPMSAEEIVDTLHVARSNVSTSLRELQSWGLVKEVHILGDRRAHFESLKDVWQMYRLILEERKRREIDPTLAMLRESVAALEKPASGDEYVRERVSETLEFFETVTVAYDETRRLPVQMLKRFGKMRGKVRKLLSIRSAGD